MKADIQIDVTNRIIAAMTSAGTNWTAPFRRSTGGGARSVDGHHYTGINALLLGLLGGGVWATYKAWQKHGAQVSKGERGTGIVFFKTITKEDSQTGEAKSFPIARGYTVFSADQVTGWDGAEEQAPPDPIHCRDRRRDPLCKRERVLLTKRRFYQRAGGLARHPRG